MRAFTVLLALVVLVGGGAGSYLILTQAKQLKSLDDQLEATIREKARLELKIEKLQKDLAAKTKTLAACDEQLTVLKASTSSTEADLQKKVQAAQAREKDLQAQIEAAKKEKADLAAQIDTVKKEKTELAARLAGALRDNVARLMRDFSTAQEPLWGEIRLLRVCLDDATRRERHAVVEQLEAEKKPDEKTKAFHEVLRRGGFVNIPQARALLKELTPRMDEVRTRVKSVELELARCEKRGAESGLSFDRERQDLKKHEKEVADALAGARVRLAQFEELSPVEVAAGLGYGKDTWMDSRHAANSGDVIYLVAKGAWNCTGTAHQLACGPEGGPLPVNNEAWAERRVWKEFPFGALLARVGGQVHVVPGFACILTMKAGPIEFRPNDSGGGNGKLSITIVRRRDQKQPPE